MLALLLGADDLDICPANSLSFVGGSSAFISSAAAETAIKATAPAPRVTRGNTGGTLSELFNRGGWLGGFAAGFLGSGLLGLLFGRGVIAGLGGVGGIASYVGLVCQLVLLAMFCRLFWTLWRSDNPAGAAALSPRQLADPYLRSRDDLHGSFDTSGDNAAESERNKGDHSAEITASRGGRG